MRKFFLGIVFLVFAVSSCKKFLDKKPDKSISTPSTLDDLVQLLNYYDRMNAYYPSAGEVGADNYYLLSDDWAATPSEYHRSLHIWQKFDDVGSDWSSSYRAILTANVILESVDKVPLSSEVEIETAKHIKGMALFVRAYYHYAMSQIFMPIYKPETAGNDLGIPLKKSADIDESIKRASVQQTYDFVIADVINALSLVPLLPRQKHLPSKAACYGLLSRIYLSMRSYNLAGLYADSALAIYNTLIDYNKIDASASSPFVQFNDEVIYDSQALFTNIFNQSRARIDTTLYNSYSQNDIRKTAFFAPMQNGGHYFKGNYTGKPNNPTMFTGIATDELLISRAECFARQGDSSRALRDLNLLLQHRIEDTAFSAYMLPVEAGLINLILRERRKELLYRTLRWTDLRRLNEEEEFQLTLSRELNGKRYILPPRDNRYTILIDYRSIQLSGIQQNP